MQTYLQKFIERARSWGGDEVRAISSHVVKNHKSLTSEAAFRSSS